MVDEAQQQGLARIGHINRAVNLAIRAKRQEGPLVWKSPVLSDGECNCNGFATVKYAALGDAGSVNSSTTWR
jgi:predicted transglutaminase-like cysteine proteinase